MKLVGLSYADPFWKLEDLHLGSVNLIVGKNATGKTRTLQTIDLLVKMLTQKRNLNWGSRWNATFENDMGNVMVYSFGTSYNPDNEGVVTGEKLEINGKTVLFRNPNEELSYIYNDITNGLDYVSPPIDKLILHTNRDTLKYPYLETIADWAETSFGFKFGNISPYAKFNQQEYDLLTAVEDIPFLFQKLSVKERQSLIKDFAKIGYNIEDVSVQDRETPILFFKEKGIPKPIPHFKLSQGMLRSLALVIYMHYLIGRKKAATVVIDDLCEGLDYNRATKLGQLVFDLAETNHIQLVATSNDNFLMDTIDLKYWVLLKREGSTVSSIDHENHPDLFESFRYTGLSNFDFFASDFTIKQGI